MRIAISIRGQPQLLFIEVGESVEIGDAELTTVPIPNSFVTHYGVQFPKTKLLWNSPRVLSELYLEHFGLVFVDDGVDAWYAYDKKTMPTWNIQSNILVWLSQDDPLPPAVESFDYISIHREFRWTRPAAQWIELVSRCRRDMVNMKPSCLYLRLEEMHEWVKWVENPKNKARQFAIYWLIHTQICRTDYWARVILRRFPLDIALLIMSYHFRSGPCRGPTVVHSLQDYMDAWLIDPSVENTYRLEHFRGIDWRIDPRRHRNIEFRRPIYPTLNLHRWEPPRVLDHLFGWIGRKITIEGVDAWDMSRVESAVSAFEDVMFAEHVSLRKWQFSALRNGTRMFYESNVRKYSHWTFPVLEESTNMFFRSPRAPARGLSQ